MYFCIAKYILYTREFITIHAMGKIDRAALRQRIQTLEGLSDDERAALLQLAAEGRSYGLVWEDRVEEVEERLREELPVLVEDKDLALTDGGKEAPNHILIEGDNMEALTTLSYTHEGKVDVIYIDPPYNTGNKDFVYNDSFVDSEDSYRHSKWLSFMSKRLRIAKRLLSDRGVIFISIDDNEQANLKLLCDQVFGEDKFVGGIVWFKKRKGAFLSKTLISLTEYILPYVKSDDVKLFGGLPDNSESQPIIKRTNAVKTLHFKSHIVRSKLPDGWYEPGVYGVGTSASTLHNKIEVRDGLIVSPFSISAPFTWTQDFLDEEISNGTEVFINTKNFQVRVIRKNNDSTKAIESYIDGRDISATNEDAYELLKDIFATDRPFQYSKPVNLVKKLILSATYWDPNSTVLDFFAGSGTTLHAVMQLNKEDGGKRQCILVTNNENNICREVTYERNKRVIGGYTTPKGVQVEGLHENNLRYYRTQLLPRERTNRNMRMLVAAATDLLCIKENIFDEFQVSGFKFHARDARLFSDGEQAMMVIYNEEAIPDIVDWLQTAPATNALTHSRTNAIKVYVFSPGAYAWDDDFAPVLDRVELCALPEAIYQAYKNVLPKKRAQRTTAETSPKGGEE